MRYNLSIARVPSLPSLTEWVTDWQLLWRCIDVACDACNCSPVSRGNRERPSFSGEKVEKVEKKVSLPQSQSQEGIGWEVMRWGLAVKSLRIQTELREVSGEIKFWFSDLQHGLLLSAVLDRWASLVQFEGERDLGPQHFHARENLEARHYDPERVREDRVRRSEWVGLNLSFFVQKAVLPPHHHHTQQVCASLQWREGSLLL